MPRKGGTFRWDCHLRVAFSSGAVPRPFRIPMRGFDGQFGILVIADRTPAGRQDCLMASGLNKAAELTVGLVRAMLTVCDCPGFVTGFPPVSIIPTKEQAYWYDTKSLKRFNAFVCTPYPVERRSHPCVCEYLKGGIGWAALPQPKQRRQSNAQLDRRGKPVSSVQVRLLSSNFWKR